MKTLRFLEIADYNTTEEKQQHYCAHFDCHYSALATTRIEITKSGGHTIAFYMCEEHAKPYIIKMETLGC